MAIVQNYKNNFRQIYEYFNEYIEDISFFNFDHIYYTDNMVEDVFLFCTPKDSEELDNSGVMILPNDIIEDIIILMDVTEDNHTMQAEYLIHELVHVIDYYNFADYFFDGNLNLINSHILENAYGLWSEFRAFSISQIKCYEYMDLIHSVSLTDIIIEQYELNIKDFLRRRRIDLINNKFKDYDLSKVLGSIYLLDNYYNIENISNSYIYEYLPILFKSDLIELMYDLYSLYFESDRKCKIFENLHQIQDIQSKIDLFL